MSCNPHGNILSVFNWLTGKPLWEISAPYKPLGEFSTSPLPVMSILSFTFFGRQIRSPLAISWQLLHFKKKAPALLLLWFFLQEKRGWKISSIKLTGNYLGIPCHPKPNGSPTYKHQNPGDPGHPLSFAGCLDLRTHLFMQPKSRYSQDVL